MKQSRWLNIAMCFALGLLTASAFFNAYTDHGILMAVNCFCLGFVFFSMLVSKITRNRFKKMDELMKDVKLHDLIAQASHEAFQTAMREGKIEVIPIQVDRDDGPTVH